MTQTDKELPKKAKLVKTMAGLPANEDSSALLEVDLWAIADFICAHDQALKQKLLAELRLFDSEHDRPMRDEAINILEQVYGDEK